MTNKIEFLSAFIRVHLWIAFMTELQTTRTLRYAFGLTLAIAIAYWFQWTLSYILPIFVSMFLVPPSKPISLKSGGLIFATITSTALSGYLISTLLASFPYIMILIVLLIIFLTFYAGTGDTSPLLVLWMLIGTLLLPMLALTSPQLSLLVAHAFIICTAVGIPITWVAHTLFPDPSNITNETTKEEKPKLDEQRRLLQASIRTAIVIPLVIVFYVFGLNEAIVTMLFAAIIILQPDIQSGKKASAGLLIGCAFGGVVSIIVYTLLVMVPTYPFMLAIMFLTLLMIAHEMFSDKPTAPLYGLSISTFLIIIGSSVSFNDSGASSIFYTRIMLIFLAGIYVVIAYSVVEVLYGERIKKTSAAQQP